MPPLSRTLPSSRTLVLPERSTRRPFPRRAATLPQWSETPGRFARPAASRAPEPGDRARRARRRRLEAAAILEPHLLLSPGQLGIEAPDLYVEKRHGCPAPGQDLEAHDGQLLVPGLDLPAASLQQMIPARQDPAIPRMGGEMR